MKSGVRPLIAGNWKMNGDGTTLDRLERLRALVAGAGPLGADILVCPPATLLHRAATVLGGSSIASGGQDCHAEVSGAHTGDVSAAMLREAGATHVIVGHSERRADHGETDAAVRAKAAAAIAAGLVPIVCVGETEAERAAGAAESVVERQVAGSLPDEAAGPGIVVAYEPVWAIGTGRTATTDDIAAMHAHIRALLTARFGEAGRTARLLYGGSVKPDNAAAILAVADVNGALVGGASLDPEDFFAIVSAA